ncbi:MAG: DUF4845 domain-containing protein [Pseudomonadota bacterium]
MASYRQYYTLKHAQHGLTLLGLIATLAIFSVILLFAMKLFPIYFESYEVTKTLESLHSDTKLNLRSAPELLAVLQKRLNINDVSHVGKDQITIKYTERSATVRVIYEVRKHFFGNIDFVASFDKQTVIPL